MTGRENRFARSLPSIVFAFAASSLLATGAVAQGKGTVRIAEADWTSNHLHINLAKIILEEHMGYDVELVLGDYTAM